LKSQMPNWAGISFKILYPWYLAYTACCITGNFYFIFGPCYLFFALSIGMIKTSLYSRFCIKKLKRTKWGRAMLFSCQCHRSGVGISCLLLE
jgi:hypothetical protein